MKKLMTGRTRKWRSSSVNVTIWLCLLVHECLRNIHTSDSNVSALNLSRKNQSSVIESVDFDGGSYLLDSRGDGGERDNFTTENSNKSCRYYQANEQLVCNGSIDLTYIRQVQGEKIRDLIVENYKGVVSPRNELSFVVDSRERLVYLTFPDKYRKLTGRVQLKNTGLKINIIVSILPKANLGHRYGIEGEAFSTKLVKISKKLRGDLNLFRLKDHTVVSLAVETTGPGAKWSLRSIMIFSHYEPVTHYDNWMTHGTIQCDEIGQNDDGYFRGFVKTKMLKEEFKFFGEVVVQNANLMWDLKGRIASRETEKVTIPRAAFSNMSVRHIVFRNSDFFHDFDENVFEGTKTVKTISFLSSKLEGMPRLNKLFESFTDLREIYIEDCTTPQLNFGVRANLQKVQKVSFKGTGPLNFDENTFLWLRSSNVTYLNLRNSYVILVHKENFSLGGISKSLRYLDISKSNLDNEEDLTVILNDLNITYLAAEGLQLKKIPTSALARVKSTLRFLSLRGNNFRKVLKENIFNTIFNFPVMLQLEELNLAECQINYLEREAFDTLPNLKILHLGNNNLENLQDGWITSRPKLAYLDLSYNGLAPQISYSELNAMETTLDLSIFTNLKVLILANGIFLNTTKVIRSLNGGNLQQLSLRNTNVGEIPGDIFQNLTRLEVLDLSYNKKFKSTTTFSIKLFRNLKKLKMLILKGCQINVASLYQTNSNDSLTAFTSLQYLDLSYNNIKMNDFVTFKIFPNLKFLKLSGNGITTWKNSLFNFSVQLEGIYLDENKIETLSPDMIGDIRKLKFVRIGNNPFVCGSYVYEVLKMTENATQVGPGNNVTLYVQETSDALSDGQPIDFDGFYFNGQISSEEGPYFLDWSERNYVCFSPKKRKFMPFTWVRENFEAAMDTTSGLQGNVFLWILFAATLAVGMYCWKVLDIHLITKAVRNAVALSFISRKHKDSEKYEYNLFVSYSDKDRPWVIDNLIPHLQSKGDVKVCLHERDFQVGLSILENIIASIDNSRIIMLVLSVSFLKSQWCQYEMHLAQHRLLEKGRDQLILILLEDIPVFKRPRILRYLMMTKTYLEWPINSKNPKDIDLFWTRLSKSLT